MKENRKPVFRVVLLYVVFSAIWIYFSDLFVQRFATDSSVYQWIQTYKGVGFVIVSGILLTFLLLSEMSKRERAWREYTEDRNKLLEQLQRTNAELEEAYDATIEGWSVAQDMRNHDVREHSLRVTNLAIQLSLAMGLRNEEICNIRRGALLHDIGKMSIPDSILLKAGPLTAEERLLIEQHPQRAYDMLSSIQFLQPSLDIPHYHHERWDGLGYPHHLKGEEIPLAARIFSVVDVYDALTSNRSYRTAMNDEEAKAYLLQEAGKAFDPQVVEAFMGLNGKLGEWDNKQAGC